MTPLATALLVAGVAVVAAAASGALVLRDTRSRLHTLTVVSTVGGPLITVAVAVDGSATVAVQALIVGALMALTGPVLGAATGRLVSPPREGRERR